MENANTTTLEKIVSPPSYGNDLDLQVKRLVAQFRENGGKAQRLAVRDIDPDLSRRDLEAVG